AFILALGTRRVVQRLLRNASNPYVGTLLGRLTAFVVFSIGFVYALNRIGVSIAPLLGIFGLLGLALAFAFQDILENFIAGILMSIRKPFESGDQVTTVGFSGVVEDINLRTIDLRTFAGERVFIPNAMVWKEPIVNHTLLGNRRTTLDIGVGYDADLELATSTIVDAVSTVDGVSSEPAPEAFAHAFGDSGIDIAIRFWHQPAISDEWRVRDGVAKAVKAALDREGIEIPFPQRVVHIDRDDHL
ncbi:MAG: mechanosensitive ion channel family protein, partial [Acidimicrobiia bacterium]|nr:mechanosensitive ion channel family protein [Acidimicrobiia bacterium]